MREDFFCSNKKYCRYTKTFKQKNSIMTHTMTECKISGKISYFINKNKNKILISLTNIEENEEFYILLIKDVFIYFYNETDLLDHQNLFELKGIPFLIYNIARNVFLIKRRISKEEEFLEKIDNLYGFIYLATNQANINKKVYVGQTLRTIKEEWSEILRKGRTLRKKREECPNKKFKARYIHNAIARYPDNVWDLRLIDISYSKSELDKKEIFYIVEVYDSMNPTKGYNLTTGGRTGGRLSKRTKKKVSQSVSKVWDTPGYKEAMCEIQKEAWKGKNGKVRREKVIDAQLKSWDNIERREKAGKKMTERWNDDEKRESLIESLKKASKESWQDPTDEMLKALKSMHQKTKKVIPNIKEFLIDIKNNKNQSDFLKGHRFEKYGIKSHVTYNTKITEILGRFGVRNHGEAHRFFYDRSIDEVMKYLDNPNGYSIFKDPLTRQFFKDVNESKKGADLHVKYRVWHKQGLITKIKRIVGKFGINNYTELKWFLQDNGVDESLKYFEQLEKA